MWQRKYKNFEWTFHKLCFALVIFSCAKARAIKGIARENIYLSLSIYIYVCIYICIYIYAVQVPLGKSSDQSTNQ